MKNTEFHRGAFPSEHQIAAISRHHLFGLTPYLIRFLCCGIYGSAEHQSPAPSASWQSADMGRLPCDFADAQNSMSGECQNQFRQDHYSSGSLAGLPPPRQAQLTGLAAPNYQQARQPKTDRPSDWTIQQDNNGKNTSFIQSHHEWLRLSG